MNYKNLAATIPWLHSLAASNPGIAPWGRWNGIGAPAHSAGYLKLDADPNVTVQVANDKFSAVARVAEGAEREQLWQAMVDYYAP